MITNEENYIYRDLDYNDVDEILDRIGPKYIVDYYGLENILDESTVNEVVEYYNDEDVLNCFDIDDLSEHFKYDVLDRTDVDEIIEYVGEDSFKSVLMDAYDVGSLKNILNTICRTYKPNGVLMKEDVKDIVNKFIDENYYA